MGFTFASQGATASQMTNILYLLTKYTDEREKLTNVLSELFPDPNESIDYSILNNCEYLDMFLNECLRFIGITSFTTRVLNEDITIGG